MKVFVYYCNFSRQYLSANFNNLMQMLPIKMQDSINKFKIDKSRYQRLVGRLLLLKLLKDNNLEINLINIEQNNYGRPMLNNGWDFNISHSGDIAVCVFSKDLTVGIDIEFIRGLNIEHFKRYMTQEQWVDIMTNPEPLKRFFHYWTLKESVLKASGKGLRGNLLEIKNDTDGRVFFDNNVWQTKPLPIYREYYCHLAYEYCKKTDIIVRQIEISDLDTNT